MRMIALKDFYDHYAGKEVKKDEVFNVLDSRKDDMLNMKVDGELVCAIYNEDDKPKKNIVIRRNDAVRYISVIGSFIYIIFSIINKSYISTIIYNLLAIFILYNIYIVLSNCFDILKSINKNIKK